MNKQKAIDELKKQIQNIPKNSFYDNGWKGYTAEIIKKSLSIDSEIYSQFIKWTNAKWFIIYPDTEYQWNQVYKEQNEKVINILNSSITFLENYGIQKQKNSSNFISKLPNEWAIFWLGVIVISWGGLCFWFGTYTTQNKIDQEKVELKNDNKILRKSILFYEKTSSQKFQPKMITDSLTLKGKKRP